MNQNETGNGGARMDSKQEMQPDQGRCAVAVTGGGVWVEAEDGVETVSDRQGAGTGGREQVVTGGGRVVCDEKSVTYRRTDEEERAVTRAVRDLLRNPAEKQETELSKSDWVFDNPNGRRQQKPGRAPGFGESEKQKAIRRKPFYAGYTDHMLNFYVSTIADPDALPEADTVDFRNEIDEMNWLACDVVFRRLTRTERACCYALHNAKHEDRPGTAEHLADAYQLPVQMVWKTDYRIQHMIAVERGLVSRKELESRKAEK